MHGAVVGAARAVDGAAPWLRMLTVLGWVCAAPLPAQESPGFVLIQEPPEWRGELTRGLVVRPRRSVRVIGEAGHPTGVARVLIDGAETSFEPLPGNRARFVGYASPEPGTDRVEIVVYPAQGQPVVRTYSVEIEEASTTYENPEAAWAEGGFDGERYAVVVGVSEYRDRDIAQLRYADDDAQLFYEFLTSPAAGLGGFKPENVRLLKDDSASYAAMRTALSGFLRPVTERDVVVFYFAGHGAPDPYARNEYYFLTHDTRASDIAGTAYPMSDVYDRIRRLRARDIIVIADACHSGAVTPELATRAVGENEINRVFLERLQTTAAGLLTLTAAETNQLSMEDARWGGGHGVFTWKLVEGLRGQADQDRDEIVTLHELIEYTRSEVQRETDNLQIPAVSGQFNRAWPMAIASPAAIADAVATVPATAAPEGPSSAASRPEPARVTSVDLVSEGWAFTHSLVIPGSGQFTTGRALRGALVLAGVIGAGAYAFLSRTITETCTGPPNPSTGRCYPGELASTHTSYPALLPAGGAAGGLTLLGAIDALLGARQLNRARLREASGGAASAGAALVLLPGDLLASRRPGDIRLLELRIH